MVGVLLEAGAKKVVYADGPNIEGMTPLHYAARSGVEGAADIVRALLRDNLVVDKFWWGNRRCKLKFCCAVFFKIGHPKNGVLVGKRAFAISDCYFSFYIILIINRCGRIRSLWGHSPARSYKPGSVSSFIGLWCAQRYQKQERASRLSNS